jgi:hypothetical protein
MNQVLRQRGQRWKGRGWLFKKAGWRPASAVAYWSQRHKEPLLLDHQHAPLPFDHPAVLAAHILANEPELYFFHWELEFPQVFHHRDTEMKPQRHKEHKGEADMQEHAPAANLRDLRAFVVNNEVPRHEEHQGEADMQEHAPAANLRDLRAFVVNNEVPPPYTWDEERRAVLRAELDARIARLYGLTRDELRYILDPHDVYGPDFPGETFRVLKEKETRLYGEYRTRRLVLAAWDAGDEG